MRSMTGFGQGAAENARLRAVITLRGVNHRHLDLSLRLRDERLRALERSLRDLLAERLERGRVELTCELERLERRPAELTIDVDIARDLRSRVASLADQELIVDQVTLSDLLRVPDAVRVEVPIAAWTDDDDALVKLATERALEQLIAGRSAEGRRLSEVLAHRLAKLEELVEAMRARAPEVPRQAAVALAERARRLADDRELDPERLAQEAAILAERGDVSEEIDRLDSHVAHFREVAAGAGAVGKRLDFLSQEIFRELNTIAAKCRDGALTRLVLDGKVLCEQLREQVQNVE
ncbi:MAG: YicC/YloC family endoribonuclease [Acidobacteriota bacterium]